MKEYLRILDEVRVHGVEKTDRTGTGTICLPGVHARYDLRGGKLPLVTTKKLHLPAIIHELLWFLKGDTNVQYLKDNGVRIWNEWADENGELGPIYGEQWRNFNNSGFDQISYVMDELKNNPDSRRMLVSAWNPEVLPDPDLKPHEQASFGWQALPPCHTLFQFTTTPIPGKDERFLHCHLYQRSGDMFLGVPFNIASYSLLTHMVAHCVGMKAASFSHYIADAHIYSNHLEQVKEQLSRKTMGTPKVGINEDVKDLFKITADDIAIINYSHHPAIKAPVAV